MAAKRLGGGHAEKDDLQIKASGCKFFVGAMSVQIDWSLVKREHVLNACKLYDNGTELPLRPARNTFLIHSERAYPAKFILGTAYRIATGHRLDPSTDYSGGEETARRLRGLGFEVQYEPEPDS